jgi:enoyl-CoA hydratase
VGLYLVVACDLAFAAEEARIGHPDQRLAFAGSSFLLINEFLAMGTKRARELLLTGRLIDGNEAAQMGLVNKAVPADGLQGEVERYAKAISLLPRDAIAIGKAHTFMAFDTLGFGASINQAFVAHTLATNVRFEEDEFNFLKIRKENGAKRAFHKRDTHWKNLGF